MNIEAVDQGSPPPGWVMNLLNFRFTQQQRRIFDRYINFLSSFAPIFTNIPVVFERRAGLGHRRATMALDTRLMNAPHNERFLASCWAQSNEAKILCGRYRDDLATFIQECLVIMEQTSRRAPVSQLDYRAFSLAGSAQWILFPPRNMGELVHELNLRFRRFQSSAYQLKYLISTPYEESFGLNAVMMMALDHRSCHCHSQPTVGVELFKEAWTSPVWDIAYSSTEATIRAAEFQADIASLSRSFATLGSRMGVVVLDIYRRADRVIDELSQATYAVTLGELICKLRAAMTSAEQCMQMISELEDWLRKD